MEICALCHNAAYFGVSEVFYEDRSLIVEACCEANLEGWLLSFNQIARPLRRKWMLEQTGIHVKDVLADDHQLSWTLDYGLELHEITFREACDFVAEHHRHCAPPAGWKFGAAVVNGPELIGVVMAGRPVSRALDSQGCIEVNRVCVKECSPRELADNACSILYGYACRTAFRQGYDRVVTYTLNSEPGTSLRAAGFRPVAKTRGGSWNRVSRMRQGKASTKPKVRWERWRHPVSLPIQMVLPLAA